MRSSWMELINNTWHTLCPRERGIICPTISYVECSLCGFSTISLQRSFGEIVSVNRICPCFSVVLLCEIRKGSKTVKPSIYTKKKWGKCDPGKGGGGNDDNWEVWWKGWYWATRTLLVAASKSGYCFKVSMKFRFNSCVTTPPVVLVTSIWILL